MCNIEKRKTHLTNSNVESLQKMFKDEDSYVTYLNTLCILRKATFKTLECVGLDSRGKNHPNYLILKLTNELIDSLLQDGYWIEDNKVMHNVSKAPIV